jgi:hypothetical protein
MKNMISKHCPLMLPVDQQSALAKIFKAMTTFNERQNYFFRKFVEFNAITVSMYQVYDFIFISIP